VAQFAPPPPPLPRSRRLQPQLIPGGVVAGSFTVGVGAGIVSVVGTGVSLTTGQTLAPGVGEISVLGQPVALSLGAVAGFNVGTGAISFFGNTVGLVTQVAPTPVVTPTLAPFNPALAELSLDIWERVGVQAGALTTTHINSLRRSMNLVLARWANRGINLWRVGQVTVPLVAGVSTYALDTSVIDMLDTYVRTTFAGTNTDIIMTPMSRNTYAALPNKAQAGRPILYWFNRLITPSVTVWPVPDTTAYSMPFFAFTQIADMDIASGNLPNLPYRFLEAFTAAAAAHLAQKWAPAQRAMALDGYAKECWEEASDEDREHVTLTMGPDFSAYFS
jgi:hypothetical protein